MAYIKIVSQSCIGLHLPTPTGHDTTVIVLYNVTVVTGIFLQNVLIVISIVVFLFTLKSSECC